MKIADFMRTAEARYTFEPWYDWFCKDSSLPGKVRRHTALIDALIARYAGTVDSIFLKHNPGMHWHYDTETMLVQLYEDGYAAGSNRVCLSIVNYSRRSWNKTIKHTVYELNVWQEGEYIDAPLFSTNDKREMTAFLKNMIVTSKPVRIAEGVA